MSLEFKIILAGPPGSGKTEFIDYGHLSTRYLGTNFLSKEFSMNGELVKVLVMELNKKIIKNNINLTNTDGCLLCFDTSYIKTFKKMPKWIKTIRKKIGNIPIFIIGTKIDLNYEVHCDKVRKLVKEYYLDGYYFISMHLGFNKEQLLKEIVNKIILKSEITFKKALLKQVNSSRKDDLSNLVKERTEKLYNNLHPQFPHTLRPLHLKKPYLRQPPNRDLPFSPRNLSGLRDEMLAELERLKTIMRGKPVEILEDGSIKMLYHDKLGYDIPSIVANNFFEKKKRY